MANLLAAALTLSATLFYVFVYTLWLKPRTVQNIVIGGAAGAVPALVGWAAVRNDLAAAGVDPLRDRVLLDAGPLLGAGDEVPRRLRGRRFPDVPGRVRHRAHHPPHRRLRDDHGRADVRDDPHRATSGRVYAVSVLVLGAIFVTRAFALVRDPTPKRAIQFFGWSNVYLMLVFVAVAVDALVH